MFLRVDIKPYVPIRIPLTLQRNKGTIATRWRANGTNHIPIVYHTEEHKIYSCNRSFEHENDCRYRRNEKTKNKKQIILGFGELF